jgi:hypothetical protein
MPGGIIAEATLALRHFGPAAVKMAAIVAFQPIFK